MSRWMPVVSDGPNLMTEEGRRTRALIKHDGVLTGRPNGITDRVNFFSN